jgi:hypothetical protein
MTMDQIQTLASKAVIAYLQPDQFEAARDVTWNAILELVEEGASRNLDLSSISMDRPAVFRLRLIRSPKDLAIETRIQNGRKYLEQETQKILVHNPGAVLEQIPGIIAIMDRIHSFEAWLGRPQSMYEMVGDPPKMMRIPVRDPDTVKIRNQGAQ